MKLTGSLSGTYIPTFKNNQDLPKNEQMSVKINYPTHEMREMLKSEISYVQANGNTEIKVKTNHAQVIRSCIGNITNLETEIDGLITDGKALLEARDPRLEPLIEELVVEVRRQSILEEEGEKNSA